MLKAKEKRKESECQRTARKDKKAFLSEQCKEKEENNRMEKTKKETSENISCKDGHNKGQKEYGPNKSIRY